MAVLWSVLLASQALAQVTHGEIAGVVRDPGGQIVPGARVTASDTLRSWQRATATDAAGSYRLVNLPSAVYDLAVTRDGFAPLAIRGVKVTVNSRIPLDAVLALAPRADAVQVAAEATPLQTETAELGTVFERSRIASLPLNRRDFLQLALLTPGVLPPVEDSELSSRGGFAMHANGGREEANNFLLDGADNNDPNVNRYNLQPSVEAIEEFKIASSSYSAEYGRSGAGQVNVITRSGTSQWRGFAYDYLRNRALDARNFFAGPAKPQFVRNQFGAGLGGPVWRNRSFFFANAEWLRERRGLARLATVPPASTRDGNLSELGRPIFDPFTRQPFPGNTVPASRIPPAARNVLALFPLPDRAGLTGNLQRQPVLRDNTSSVHGRYDHLLGARDTVTLRYGLGDTALLEPFAEDTAAVPGFGSFVEDRGNQAMVHHQHAGSPRTVNSLRLAFNRFSRRVLPQNYQVDANRVLGVNWVAANERAAGFPILNVAGFSSLGDAASLPIVRATNTYQVTEAWSAVLGRHVLRLGGEVRHNQLNGNVDFFTRGSLSFSGALSGTGLSDLLLGLPSFGLQAQADNPQTLRSTAYNAYLQDDWRLNPSLTLNLGVRYEYVTPPTDPADRMTTLDFATARLARVGTAGIPRAGVRADRNNFAPRAGLAWRLRPDTVLRAGYGLYFDSGMFIVNSAQYFNPPQFNLRVFFPTATSLLTLQDPFRGGITPPATLNLLDPNLVGGSLQHWNLTLQHRLQPLGLVTVAYAGSKGTHLIRSRNLNQPPPGPGDIQARRPLAAYGSILLVESGSNSNYHSLQATWDRPLARGVSLWAVYTLSKSIDDTSAFLGTRADKNFPQDSRNFRAERAVSSYDIRQRFTTAYTIALPGKHALARNTELRGITTLQSAPAFTPVLRFDNSNTGNTGGSFGFDRPDVRRNPALAERGPDRWFDTAAFSVPARYQFGGAGRNILRGAPLYSFDLSLVRRFILRDRHALSLEAQAFNLFNRANFELPEAFADEPTFGRIQAAKAARQLQVALRYTF